ncbi:SDR family NAD(P)-dependent oxidoreductase [Eubacterium xylanophilum]|uniref:SDR family NAD(P)-dependent oxidoreductase n=1 Tax=Eubacterium xylanophilum TaxID=39497 RepID=UPI00047AA65D|nr:SDR family oxidoreductase [Eubacterium xylanophilum]
MYNVKDKWCFITGAARGLGYLAAKYMAEQGCNLILHSRDKSHTEKVVEELEQLGVKVYAVAADLNYPEQVSAMLEEIDALGLQIDIVLNNAGLQIAYRTEYFQTPVEDYTISFNVNTIAPAMICYHFMPKMMERGSGRIVNTTSGIEYDVYQAGYSASKAALDKITIDLATKVDGSDVMLNLVDPGWCRTDLGGPNAPNAPESVIPGIVLGVFADDKKSGRIIRAQEFAGMTMEAALATL